MDRIKTQEDVLLRDAIMNTSLPFHHEAHVNEITPLKRSQRTASWSSDDTMVRSEQEELLSSKLEDEATVPSTAQSTARFGHPLYTPPSYAVQSRKTPRRGTWLILCAILLTCFVAVDLLARASGLNWPDDEDRDEPDRTLGSWGTAGSGTEGLAWYPTNFLQDVVPKPIHSHNDYWRKVPLFTALRQGCISVEADVWLVDDDNEDDDTPEQRRDSTLYVGHERAALQPNRTFASLYVQPLVDILERANPRTAFSRGHSRGVFDTSPNQTLTLLVDVKTAGPATWAAVVAQLAPLRERGWLSFLANGTTHTRPVTVVGTGGTPFAQLLAAAHADAGADAAAAHRDYFFDAPLPELRSERAWDATNSYYASASFAASIGTPWLGGLGAEQVERIRAHVAAAHARGLRARYWDLPAWPVGTRNRIWDLLVKEGVDVLNVDDVRAAARRTWRY